MKTSMAIQTKKKLDLDKKFQKVLQTPASFAFFVAIHDFIEYIESDSTLLKGLSHRIKINRELDLPAKYAHLKQIYQGVEDTGVESNDDWGHNRYMVVRDLDRIQNKDVSDSNSFWKKRDIFRKLTIEIYERLNVHLSKNKK